MTVGINKTSSFIKKFLTRYFKRTYYNVAFIRISMVRRFHVFIG